MEPLEDAVASARHAASIVAPRTSAPAETWSSHFVGLSMKRAFRLHILNEEVLPTERAVMESQAGHITDPEQQAFLAWRRSVLLMVALMFIPLSLMRFIDSWNELPVHGTARFFLMIPALAEAAFCVTAFVQLKNWAQWRKQRRVMFWAWLLYFLSPFVVYLYPFRGEFEGHLSLAREAVSTFTGLNLSGRQAHLLLGTMFGLRALLALAPKIISLMPGLIRASIVSKLLFPGTTAPGWLMMMAAPFYALFIYVIVLFPYQVTGSWQFVVGNAGILGAQVYIAMAGRRLTVPLTVRESSERIHKSWLVYIGILVVSASMMVYGLADFLRELHYTKLGIVTGLLGVMSNVLLDTLVGTDAIVTAMAYFRRRGVPDPKHEELLRNAEAKLDVFCG